MAHLTVLTAWQVFCSAAWAIDASHVLVLYNTASPDGLQIADYYAQIHPGVHLLGINGVGTSDDISADDYLSTIRPQVLSALTRQTMIPEPPSFIMVAIGTGLLGAYRWSLSGRALSVRTAAPSGAAG